MMKKIIISACLLTSVATFSQTGRVGINTTDPKSSLDVTGKTDATGNLLATDVTGLQAPRLTRAELTAKGDAMYGTDQNGALVYITDISAGDALTQRENVTAVGYYYFDGAQNKWVKISSVKDLIYYKETQDTPSNPAMPVVTGTQSFVIGDQNQLGNAGSNAIHSMVLGYGNSNVYAIAADLTEANVIGNNNSVFADYSYVFGKGNVLDALSPANHDILGIGFSNSLQVSNTGAIGKNISNSTEETLQLGWGKSLMTLTNEYIGIKTVRPSTLFHIDANGDNDTASPITSTETANDVVVEDITGNLGVGTDSPKTKLEVNGVISNTTTANFGQYEYLDFSKSNFLHLNSTSGNSMNCIYLKNNATYYILAESDVSFNDFYAGNIGDSLITSKAYYNMSQADYSTMMSSGGPFLFTISIMDNKVFIRSEKYQIH